MYEIRHGRTNIKRDGEVKLKMCDVSFERYYWNICELAR